MKLQLGSIFPISLEVLPFLCLLLKINLCLKASLNIFMSPLLLLVNLVKNIDFALFLAAASTK